MARVINGVQMANNINKLTKILARNYIMSNKNTRRPIVLATVWVGGGKASAMYAKMKYRKAKELNICAVMFHFSNNINQPLLNSILDNLSQNPQINAILLQLPLPKNLNADEATKHITPSKDVDGVNPINLGQLASNVNNQWPTYPIGCTPRGIMYMIQSQLDKLDVNHRGLPAVVIGRSNIVGRPLNMLLLNAGCQVTTLNHLSSIIKLNNNSTLLHSYLRHAAIIISATGHPNLVKADDINPAMHPILIDAGEDTKNGHLCGDISQSAKDKSFAYTPVPGGVGPMTIAMLMRQTVELANHSLKETLKK